MEGIPESLLHYTDANDFNRIFYYAKNTDYAEKALQLLADADILSDFCKDQTLDWKEYEGPVPYTVRDYGQGRPDWARSFQGRFLWNEHVQVGTTPWETDGAKDWPEFIQEKHCSCRDGTVLGNIASSGNLLAFIPSFTHWGSRERVGCGLYGKHSEPLFFF